ncbi:MAG: Hsp20/alpha crystallin family protein [Cytophagales bacterium]|nr:Hsp20/alpha crystallin family protein [Cytophagales bacterium]
MMSLIKRNGEVPVIRSLFSDLFDTDRFFDNDPFFGRTRQLPSVNIKETDTAFHLELAAPGVSKQDFNVQVNEGVLTVSAERQEEKTEEQDNYTRREFSYHSFARSFQLPPSANADSLASGPHQRTLRWRGPQPAGIL